MGDGDWVGIRDVFFVNPVRRGLVAQGPAMWRPRTLSSTAAPHAAV